MRYLKVLFVVIIFKSIPMLAAEKNPELLRMNAGWERLLFDVGDKKMAITLMTSNRTFEGQIVKVEGGIIAFRENSQKDKKPITYIPVNLVTSVTPD